MSEQIRAERGHWGPTWFAVRIRDANGGVLQTHDYLVSAYGDRAEEFAQAHIDRVNAQPRPLPSGITEEMVFGWKGDQLWCWLHLLPGGAMFRYAADGDECRKITQSARVPVLVSVPQEPKTEKVEWWKAKGRRLLSGAEVYSVGDDGRGVLVWADPWPVTPGPDGMVEVLREGDR